VAVGEKRYHDALSKYESALKAPGSASVRPLVLCNMALCYLELGNNASAIRCAKDAIRVRPNYLKAHVRLIRAHLSSNNPEKAGLCYLNAMNQFSATGSVPVALQELWTFIEAASESESESESESGLSTEGKTPFAVDESEKEVSLGKQCVREKNYTQALQHFDKALQMYPENFECMLHIVGTHLMREAYADAIEQCEVLEALLQAKSNAASGGTLLARSFHRKGKALFALKRYPAALQAFQHSYNSHNTSSALKDMEKVQQILLSLSSPESTPSSTGSLSSDVRPSPSTSMSNRKSISSSVSLPTSPSTSASNPSSVASSTVPRTSTSPQHLSRSERSTTESAESANSPSTGSTSTSGSSRAPTSGATSSLSRCSTSSSLCSAGASSEIALKLQQCRELRSAAANRYVLADFPGALRLYEHCLAINPRDIRALCNKASALIKLKSWRDAMRALERVLEIKNNFQPAIWRKAYAEFSRNHFAGAIVQFTLLLTVNPASRTGQLGLCQSQHALAIQDACRNQSAGSDDTIFDSDPLQASLRDSSILSSTRPLPCGRIVYHGVPELRFLVMTSLARNLIQELEGGIFHGERCTKEALALTQPVEIPGWLRRSFVRYSSHCDRCGRIFYGNPWLTEELYVPYYRKGRCPLRIVSF